MRDVYISLVMVIWKGHKSDRILRQIDVAARWGKIGERYKLDKQTKKQARARTKNYYMRERDELRRAEEMRAIDW